MKYNFNTEKIKKCIDEYNKLTSSSYIDSFYYFHYDRTEVFSKLVKAKIISLEDFYITYEKNIIKKEGQGFEHLKEYVRRIKNEESYTFLNYVLANKKVDMYNIDDYGFDFCSLYRELCLYRTYENIAFKSLFPLKEEELYYLIILLDKYIFQTHPENYFDFIKRVLNSTDILEFFPKNKLRAIYFSILTIFPTLAQNKYLREKYLTKIELEKAIANDIEKEKQEKLKLFEEKKEKIINEFATIEDNNFASLYDFICKYRWDDESWEISSALIIEYLNNNIDKYNINNDLLIKFLNLLEVFIRKNKISIDEFGNYISLYIERGESNNGKIIRTC